MPVKSSRYEEMDTTLKKSLLEKTLSENKNSLATKMRSISDKTLLHNQRTKSKKNDNNRFLIIINVFGSAGPIRFVANGGDSAGEVIEAALKLYAREGRLPILGSDSNSFVLYSITDDGFDAVPASEAIGLSGARNFVLCKKTSNNKPHMTEGREKVIDRKGNGLLAWIHKHLTLRTLSH